MKERLLIAATAVTACFFITGTGFAADAEVGYTSHSLNNTYGKGVIEGSYTPLSLWGSSETGAGVYGKGTGGLYNTITYGVWGEVANYTGGAGVYGHSSNTFGGTGVYGLSSDSLAGRGVYGEAKGVWESKGVYGYASGGSGITYGVYGEAESPDGYGMYCSGKFKVTGTLERNNLASNAAVNASSEFSAGYSKNNVNDGIINRWDAGEWASNGGRPDPNDSSTYEWIQLSWANAQSISEVWIYDRPNRYDQIYDAYLYIDNDGDGVADHMLHLGMFPYGGAPKKIPLTSSEGNTSIKAIQVVITETSPDTQNAGLSEIVCYP